MNEVEVLLFARARELAGAEILRLALPEGATVGEARQALAARVPALQRFLPCCRLAVNEDVSTEDQVVPHKGVLAVLPPVSGG